MCLSVCLLLQVFLGEESHPKLNLKNFGHCPNRGLGCLKFAGGGGSDEVRTMLKFGDFLGEMVSLPHLKIFAQCSQMIRLVPFVDFNGPGCACS